MKIKKLPDIELLNRYFIYDENEGELLWKIAKTPAIKPGNIAGTRRKEGNVYYRSIEIDGIRYKAHRIIYKMHNPDWNEETIIDHISNDEIADNRIHNLRETTHQKNQFNKNANKKGTSIYKGVSWNNQRKKWKASIMINGKSIFLGLHNNEMEAAKAYEEKSKELFGDYTRN